MTQRSKRTAVSLFSGAGGMDFGFAAAGFEIAATVEMDKACCDTLRHNTSSEVIEDDVHNVTGKVLCDVAGRKPGDIDLFFGGPPCQPFSKAAYWSRGDTLRLKDPRAATLTEYVRLVEETLPKVMVLENVHGINYSGKEEGLKHLFERLDAVNRKHGTQYTPSWAVLNAAEYGIPQIRKRFFMVACRDGGLFRFPEPTHGDTSQPTLFDRGLRRLVTAWDAIGDLPGEGDGDDLTLKGRWASLLPSIPEGENYLWHTNRKGGMNLFGWRTRYWSFLLKLAKNLPSWTIQAQPGPAIGPFHWNDRQLSRRELCRLQTFPDSIEILGSRRIAQSQAGNAVPSLLAEVIGTAIREQFFSDRNSRPLTLLQQCRQTIPGPEKTAPVPSEFHCLVGEHLDHPGTGKGNAARRQRTSGV